MKHAMTTRADFKGTKTIGKLKNYTFCTIPQFLWNIKKTRKLFWSFFYTQRL